MEAAKFEGSLICERNLLNYLHGTCADVLCVLYVACIQHDGSDATNFRPIPLFSSPDSIGA